MKRCIELLRNWWRGWKHRREWTPERQLEHLREMVRGDHRWLAHDKTADALTTRYLAALGPDWMRVVHSDPCHFRREIGLEPHYRRSKLMDCMVNWNGGAWFVKERQFFEQQKESTPPGDLWHTHWRLVICVDGIEHARDKARLEWGVHGERWVDPAKAGGR